MAQPLGNLLKKTGSEDETSSSPDLVATAQTTGERGTVTGAHYLPGDLIAEKYELIDRIGEGGMGSVWRARNVSLEAEVAIKLIRADARSADGADRLLREAQAAAKLADPAILRVFDFGTTVAGDPYIVMELLDGEDLGSAIRTRGRLSPKRAARVVLPVIRALAIAHEHGIVHRDLKPENIFLTKAATGLQPKVVDFGIAQLEEAAREVRLTSTGTLMGSPLYMSPEQAKGLEVDLRADIWSLAVVLYEAVTGTVPFPGKNYNAVLCALMLKEAERPSAEFGVDDELWAILGRALNKEPAFRFQSMQEFGKALASWLTQHGERSDIAGASLDSQWIGTHSPIDQLTSILPPTGSAALFPPMPKPAEVLIRNLPTQRLVRVSSSPAETATSAPQVRRRWIAAIVAGCFVFVSGLSALVWAQLGSSNAPAREAPAHQESLVETPASPAALPVVQAKRGPTATQVQPVQPVVSADEKQPEALAPSESSTRPIRRQVQPQSHSQARAKRAAKLKNPFAE